MFLTIAVAIVCFLSYSFNTFGVVDQQKFDGFQQPSEMLVLDGILHANATSSNKVQLGWYVEPDLSRADIARKAFNTKTIEGTFHPYRSQWGLQARMFKALFDLGLRRTEQLEAFAGLLLALTVAAFFWKMLHFSLAAAVAFAATMALSPWVVLFARNLYWVPFTWYLPLLATFYLGNEAVAHNRSLMALLVLTFFAFLIKFLCGYEYITTVVIAACVPLVYYAFRARARFRLLAILLGVYFAVSLTAFAIAVAIHAASIAERNQSPFAFIMEIAEKRLGSADPAAISAKACAEVLPPLDYTDKEVRRNCERVYYNSLKASPISVLKKYLQHQVVFPWVDRLSSNLELRSEIREAIRSGDWAEFTRLARASPIRLVAAIAAYARDKVSPYLFGIFLIALAAIAARRNMQIQLTLLTALAAPVSWYVLAAPHSDVHYHMNYVLWYLPLIPIGMMLIATSTASSLRRRSAARSTVRPSEASG